MTKGPVVTVDVNFGSFEALTAVSGIGESLADKIIAGRPYASLDDLTRVQGISDASVERWSPFLTINSQDEVLPVLEAEFVEEVIEAVDEPAVEAEAVEEIEFDEAEIDEALPGDRRDW